LTGVYHELTSKTNRPIPVTVKLLINAPTHLLAHGPRNASV